MQTLKDWPYDETLQVRSGFWARLALALDTTEANLGMGRNTLDERLANVLFATSETFEHSFRSPQRIPDDRPTTMM